MINNLKHNYIKIDYKNILDAYSHGIFPMAENIDSLDVFWVKPKKRGVIDPYRINIRKKLKRFINKKPFKITVDNDFIGVIEGCAEITNVRENTWINPSIRDVFIELHYKGYAHSIECYSNNNLVARFFSVNVILSGRVSNEDNVTFRGDSDLSIVTAIGFEVGRGGQVYFVHNDIFLSGILFV